MASILLTDIPSDIIIQIFALLDLQDLISLRKTCKKFSSLSYEKTLWLQQVDKLYTENLLFPSSIPLYSLSSSLLEDIATRPVRWEKLVLQQEEITPLRTRIISTPLAFRENAFHSFLVPGGRFLFAYYEGPPRLVLLDLCTENPDIPLATLAVSGRPGFCFVPSPFEGTFSTLVFTRLIHSTATQKFLDVYDISPYEENCKFTKIASRDSDPQLISFDVFTHPPTAISANMLVFSRNPQQLQLGIIWRFRLDEWIKFRVTTPHVVKIFLLHDSIIFMHASSFSLCPVPTTGYVCNFDALRGLPEVELQVLYERMLLPDPYGLNQATDYWYSGSRYHPMVAISEPSFFMPVSPLRFYNIEHDKNMIYVRSSIGEACAPPNRSWGAIQVERTVWDSLWIPCNGGIYRVFHSSNNVAHFYCQGLKSFRQGTAAQAFSTIINVRNIIPDGARIRVSMCPHSGRASLTWSSPGSGSDSSGQILILDFFEPPHSTDLPNSTL
ncbi:hypothetical protein CVT24_001166 [Panaeolus cyanescens]|uniref:F-box domain-containing protein n=1 Tax=Panaeolus cyanescens TaxID=181874 RepID=A0A409WXU3_9AGAR|nr:hypothetical protein CVT24_001166 [Panaeolus cyanescens]